MKLKTIATLTASIALSCLVARPALAEYDCTNPVSGKSGQFNPEDQVCYSDPLDLKAEYTNKAPQYYEVAMELAYKALFAGNEQDYSAAINWFKVAERYSIGSPSDLKEAVLGEFAASEARKAKLLGYPNHANVFTRIAGVVYTD